MIDTPEPKEISEPSDWVLGFMVEVLNKTDGSNLAITLTVSGTLITGLMIGVREYFHLLAIHWEEAMGTEPAATVAKFYREVGDRAQAQARANDEKEEAAWDIRQRPHYIHLKEAQVATAQGFIPSAPGMLWRGKLSRVEGYSWGRMQVGG